MSWRGKIEMGPEESRKCPYCAEVIKKDAVICRYCARRVRGRYNRLIVKIVIIAIVVSMYIANQTAVNGYLNRFMCGWRHIYNLFEELLVQLPKSLKAVKDFRSNGSIIEEQYQLLEKTRQSGKD